MGVGVGGVLVWSLGQVFSGCGLRLLWLLFAAFYLYVFAFFRISIAESISSDVILSLCLCGSGGGGGRCSGFFLSCYGLD